MRVLPALMIAALALGDAPVMSKDDTTDVRLSVLQGIDKVAANNALISDLLEGRAPSKSTFISGKTIFLEAKASEHEAGYTIVYENAKCRLRLPPTRSVQIDFEAGRVSAVQMFVPLDMLTLGDAIKFAKEMSADFARAGCLQISGAADNITEGTLANKVGEKSAIISEWEMCGPSDVSGLATVRYFGSEFLGTMVPLGALPNPFYGKKEHYLVEINLFLTGSSGNRLILDGYKQNEKITGKRFNSPPLAQWLRHPEWYNTKP